MTMGSGSITNSGALSCSQSSSSLCTVSGLRTLTIIKAVTVVWSGSPVSLRVLLCIPMTQSLSTLRFFFTLFLPAMLYVGQWLQTWSLLVHYMTMYMC